MPHPDGSTELTPFPGQVQFGEPPRAAPLSLSLSQKDGGRDAGRGTGGRGRAPPPGQWEGRGSRGRAATPPAGGREGAVAVARPPPRPVGGKGQSRSRCSARAAHTRGFRTPFVCLFVLSLFFLCLIVYCLLLRFIMLSIGLLVCLLALGGDPLSTLRLGPLVVAPAEGGVRPRRALGQKPWAGRSRVKTAGGRPRANRRRPPRPVEGKGQSRSRGHPPGRREEAAALGSANPRLLAARGRWGGPARGKGPSCGAAAGAGRAAARRPPPRPVGGKGPSRSRGHPPRPVGEV